MRNSSKKTPWHLRFAPGAILRKKAIIAIIAVVALLTQAPVEKAEAARGGGGRVGGGGGGGGIGVGEVVGGLIVNLVANYIYDAAGNKIKVNPPMDGKITASPKVEAYGGRRYWAFINGYAHDGLRPEQDRDRKRSKDYNLDKWTEYFRVTYGEVVDNPDYDPDAEPGERNSNKYMLRSHGEFGEHGDEYKNYRTMANEYATAEYGYVYDDDGNRYMQFSKKGRWVYTGESELIKCDHRLKNEVEVGDNRLAKNQTYKAEVWYKLDELTWVKKREEFEVKRAGLSWQKDPYTLSATSSGWKKIGILIHNSEITELKEKGSSQLWWEGRAVDRRWPRKDYIVWERKQHDELNGN